MPGDGAPGPLAVTRATRTMRRARRTAPRSRRRSAPGWRNGTSTRGCRLLCDAGVPASAVLDTKDLYENPHLVGRGFVREVDHPVHGRIKLLGWPARMSESSVPVAPAPLLGQHSREVVAADLSLDDDEIDALVRAGVMAEGLTATRPAGSRRDGTSPSPTNLKPVALRFLAPGHVPAAPAFDEARVDRACLGVLPECGVRAGQSPERQGAVRRAQQRRLEGPQGLRGVGRREQRLALQFVDGLQRVGSARSAAA